MQSDKSEGFFEAAHEVYRREASKLLKEYQFKLPRPDEVSGRTDEIGDTNLLGEVRFANTGGTRNMKPPATFAS